MTDDMDSIIRNLNGLNNTIKRYSSMIKDLKVKKKDFEGKLFQTMTRKGLNEYNGYKLEKLNHKQKIPRKKNADKKADALKLFREVGIDNPELFWTAFQDTQKNIKDDE